MALKKEIKIQRKKDLKGKCIRSYLSYLWDFYKTLIFILLVLFTAGIAFFFNLHTQKDTALGIVFLNPVKNEDALWERIKTDIGVTLELNEEKENVLIQEAHYQYPGGISTQYDAASQVSIRNKLENGSMDILTADAYIFNAFLYGSTAFYDLRDVLSEDQLARYKDILFYVDMEKIKAFQKKIQSNPRSVQSDSPDAESIIKEEKEDNWVKPDPEEMEEPVPVGIIVTDSSYLRQNGLYGEYVCVMGLCSSSRHTDLFCRYVDFLLGS